MSDIVTLTCPYCGAPTDVHVETGADSYIEDCTVCCQPIELTVSTDADGSTAVEAHRGDE
ncbi:MAG TPA: CPXCG motif-containing cysteine-rich protein [Rhodanobacteraceae bacterium]|nr:CPXCG motif-containing cysteine-rich protein [Rhodanobacteraceae bacterium]